MHCMVIVIGDDVEAQMNSLKVVDEGGWSWCDWWAIGGRYTGTLPLKNGATGKTFGGARPPFEEWLLKQMPGTRLGTRDCTGDGVDQALAGDIDLEELTTSAMACGIPLTSPSPPGDLPLDITRTCPNRSQLVPRPACVLDRLRGRP
jgi:hypothetical protein